MARGGETPQSLSAVGSRSVSKHDCGGKVCVQLSECDHPRIEDAPPLETLLQETALFLWKDWPRNMEAVFRDSTVFTLRGKCPHCSHDSVFTVVSGVGREDLTPAHTPPTHRVVAAMQCQGCCKYILGIVTYKQGTIKYTYEAHYPLGTPDDSVADEIPEHIKPDFKEALRCLWVDAYNATAEMCRRAVEVSCVDLGAPEKVLEDMIDWLADQRKITPFLQQVAHKIRLGGNRGAHASTAKIEKEHADAIVKFTREFFHHVYVVPKQLDQYDFSKPKAKKL